MPAKTLGGSGLEIAQTGTNYSVKSKGFAGGGPFTISHLHVEQAQRYKWIR